MEQDNDGHDDQGETRWMEAANVRVRDDLKTWGTSSSTAKAISPSSRTPGGDPIEMGVRNLMPKSKGAQDKIWDRVSSTRSPRAQKPPTTPILPTDATATTNDSTRPNKSKPVAPWDANWNARVIEMFNEESDTALAARHKRRSGNRQA